MGWKEAAEKGGLQFHALHRAEQRAVCPSIGLTPGDAPLHIPTRCCKGGNAHTGAAPPPPPFQPSVPCVMSSVVPAVSEVILGLPSLVPTGFLVFSFLPRRNVQPQLSGSASLSSLTSVNIQTREQGKAQTTAGCAAAVTKSTKPAPAQHPTAIMKERQKAQSTAALVPGSSRLLLSKPCCSSLLPAPLSTVNYLFMEDHGQTVKVAQCRHRVITAPPVGV